MVCNNHNGLLTSYEGAFTGKTGFTSKAGYCYTGAAKRGEKTLIIALLGSGWYPHKSYKWKDAKKLLDYGFETFSYQEIGKANWEFSEIEVVNGMKPLVFVKTNAKKFNYLVGDHEKVQCKVEMADKLQAPVEENMVVGKIYYELNGEIIEKFDIYTSENIEESTFWNQMKKWLRYIQDFVLVLINK